MIRRLAFCLVFVFALGACQDLPTGDLVVYPVDAPELARASVSADGSTYETAPWSGMPWLFYPGRASLQIEHTLGRTPRGVLVYLAFDPQGTEPGLAAGDLARLVQVDETTVTVRNDTNASFYVRVVAF